MKKPALFIYLIFFTAFSIGSLSIYTPEEIIQGEVLRIIIRDDMEPENRIICKLLMDGKVWSRSESFTPFDREDGESWIGVVLLGVPSDIPAGEGQLKIGLSGFPELEKNEFESERGITVFPFDFIKEDIPLNSYMSDLRQDDGPEKARQWRILHAILMTFNPGNVYQKDSLSFPIKSDTRRTSYYGDRRNFIYSDGGSSRSIHHGIDFSAPPGTSVYSPGIGRVVFSGTRILSGETLVIEHLPGVYSSCYHLRERFVSEGDMVEEGELLGTVGATGLVTGAHLHWEIRVNGVSVAPDPLTEGPLIDKTAILSIIE